MKNKEIEELLNELKEYASGGMSGLYPSEDTVKKFVSYIEQLENNRDKAIEYVKEFRFATVKFEQHSDTLLNILKGGSDESR